MARYEWLIVPRTGAVPRVGTPPCRWPSAVDELAALRMLAAARVLGRRKR